MLAYLIARFDMTDADRAKDAYKRYVDGAGPAYEEHGARFLVRGGTAHPLEGEARTRNVVIEFPSLEKARACYESDVYQKARAHRLEVAEGEIVLVQGAVASRDKPGPKKGYWIARRDVKDLAHYKKYVEGSGRAFEEYEALFLARGGPHQALEGQARERNVLIEFPSVQHALDCYNSDIYQRASENRLAAATGETVIVEGA